MWIRALKVLVCTALLAPASLLTAALSARAAAEAPPLAAAWIHGQANCHIDNDPPFQVVRLNSDTFILRQDKCLQYEAPFIYLLFGNQKVLMLDTSSLEVPENVSESAAKNYPLRQAIDQLILAYAAAHHLADLPLYVVHTHGHADHIAGDPLFYHRANTQVVDPGVESVQAFWGFSSMQAPATAYDLGGRILDVLPIPGHLDDHIAIYDRNHAVLLSGDSLYPGRLYIDDWTAYRASMDRLQAFITLRPLDYVLGAHIEMSDKAGVDYRIGSTYQPHEHVLELYRRHLNELDQALRALGQQPQRQRHADFIIDP